MAKKLLISDNKLGWIRDTSSGISKSPVDKIIVKTEKPAAPSMTPKKSLPAETAIEATGTEHRTEPRKILKAKAASKMAHTPKRPLAAKTSLIAPPPIKPLDRMPPKQQKTEPAPQPKTVHDSQADASLSYQTYEAALAPIEKKTSAPIAETPLTLKESPTENNMPSKLRYLISVAALISAVMFLPERYSLFVFLGFIFIALIEVSYRLGKQYNLLKSISENGSKK
jgi:hypothetical protein